MTTYKAIAEALDSRAYQLIGQIVRRNPDPPAIPCHRVVKSDGRIGGFKGESAGEAVRDKIALLESEGVQVKDGRVRRFEELRFSSSASPV